MFDFESVEKELNLKFENLEMKIVYLYYVKRYSINLTARELRCSALVVKEAIQNTFGMRTAPDKFDFRTSAEYRESLSLSQLGENNNSAKLTESDVLAIRQQYPILQGAFTKSQSQYLLADEYGVKRPTISDIVLRRTWKHI